MKNEVSRSMSLREPTTILLLIVAFCAIYTTWLPIRNVPASDFYQFWVVGQEIKAGQVGDIYSDSERRRLGRKFLDQARADQDPIRLQAARQRVVLETFSTPFLYTTFATLSSNDYARDLASYRRISLLFVVFSVALLCHLLGYGLISTIAAITLFTSWFGPSRSDWLVGNVNSLQLGWLVLFLWVSCRFPTTAGHIVGGVLLGLGAMFKPNLAIVIAILQVSWLIRGRHRKFALESAGMAGAALAAFAASSLAFGGPKIWQSWGSALSNLPDEILTVQLGNYAPARLLHDWLEVDTTAAIALVCVVVTLAAVARGLSGNAISNETRNRAGLEDIHVAALAGLIALLAAPLSWFHYFVSAIPMLLIVLGPISRGLPISPAWKVARSLAIVALLSIMMRPLVLLEIGTTRGRAVILCLGTSLLFGLGVRALFMMREDSVDAPDEA